MNVYVTEFREDSCASERKIMAAAAVMNHQTCDGSELGQALEELVVGLAGDGIEASTEGDRPHCTEPVRETEIRASKTRE